MSQVGGLFLNIISSCRKNKKKKHLNIISRKHLLNKERLYMKLTEIELKMVHN